MNVEKAPSPLAPRNDSFKAERVQLRATSETRRKERVRSRLRRLPHWRLAPAEDAILRTFRLSGPQSVQAFVSLVTALAAEYGHAPALEIGGSSVTCRLSTPAIGGISDKDFQLARRISLLS